MKNPIEYLIEHYGCRDLDDLKKCFLNPLEVSITMIEEVIELAQKEAYNQAIEDALKNAKVKMHFFQLEIILDMTYQ